VAKRLTGILVWMVICAAMLLVADAAAHGGDRDLAAYQAQDNAIIDPHLRSLDEYVDGQAMFSSLGVMLREATGAFKSGASVKGLLITRIMHGSPAARAGLSAINDASRKVATGIVVAASLIFPPAMMAIPLVATLGQNGDLIIAIDSCRVKNAADFEEQMTDSQPGEIVYLTVVRDGNRVQVAVQLPAKTE
jgi:S1-C subfamily serine protease